MRSVLIFIYRTVNISLRSELIDRDHELSMCANQRLQKPFEPGNIFGEVSPLKRFLENHWMWRSFSKLWGLTKSFERYPRMKIFFVFTAISARLLICFNRSSEKKLSTSAIQLWESIDIKEYLEFLDNLPKDILEPS